VAEKRDGDHWRHVIELHNASHDQHRQRIAIRGCGQQQRGQSRQQFCDIDG
jgi:hypothetical protein